MIHLFALLSLLLCGVCYTGFQNSSHFRNTGSRRSLLLLVFGGALLLRLLLAYTTHGFSNDIACFAAWADRIFTLGPGQFYSAETFTDYPPGFMYVLYLVGALRSLLQIPYYSDLHILLLKMPAILCDIACGFLLYREAVKRLHFSELQGIFVSSAYLFQPAIILNSSCWGQVDSVYTLMVILMCLFLMEGNMLPAYAVYGLGILLKPQMLIFTPVLLAGIWDHVFLHDFSWRKFFYNLCGGLSVICGMFLLCAPFGLTAAISQYTSTLGSYEYAAINAYNFWGLLGMNWIDQNTIFLFLPCKTWGTIVILLIVLFTFLIAARCRKEPSRYFCLGAFIILTMFLFSVRMHERYMYPALALLLFCCLYRPSTPLWKCFSGFAVLHFYNTANVLYHYDPQNYDRKAPIILLVSAGMLCCLYYFYKIIWKYYVHGEAGAATDAKPQPTIGRRASGHTASTRSAAGLGQRLREYFLSPLEPIPSEERIHFTKPDLCLLLAIGILYSCFALYDLGDRKAPTTTYDMSGELQAIELEFPEDALPVTMASYLAPWHQRHFGMDVKSNAEDSWTYLGEIILNNVFTWQDVSLQDLLTQATENSTSDMSATTRYLRLSLTDNDASLIELVFLDANGNITRPLNADAYPTLFDESDLYPERYSFRNSMYFDEIYHGRTGYEMLHRMTAYETTHPPLGKDFIMLGIAIFGMTAFGWRCAGTLFGVMLVPLMWCFARRLTHKRWAGAMAGALIAAGFMRFSQSRIATIDIYGTFFILLGAYFMVWYCQSVLQNGVDGSLLPMALGGVAFGLGCASKWTGIYAGAGLAVLYLGVLYARWKQKQPGFWKEFRMAAVGGVAFYIVVPFLIYLASYLPYWWKDPTFGLRDWWDCQTYMYWYHSTLKATHPFESRWYTWLLDLRPVWYYKNSYLEAGLQGSIAGFYNPVICWAGLFCILLLLWRQVSARGTAKGAGVLILYASQLLSWMLVSRCTFMYHYFPSSVFALTAIVLVLTQMKRQDRAKKIGAGLCIAALVCFAWFYPVLSGLPVPTLWAQSTKILPSYGFY